jgi:hypothetical protein
MLSMLERMDLKYLLVWGGGSDVRPIDFIEMWEIENENNAE